MANRLDSTQRALTTLIEGNKRFSKGLRSVDTFSAAIKLKDLASKGQKPFCIVLTCSDSRAPTETIFDCGIGELFVLRIAGNVLSEALFGGIEYAVKHFDVPLCLVLGHTSCGAIGAAYQKLKTPNQGLPSLNIEKLVELILEGAHVKKSTNISNPDELGWNNVRSSVEKIKSGSPLLREKIESGSFNVVGAVYDISTGLAKFDV